MHFATRLSLGFLLAVSITALAQTQPALDLKNPQAVAALLKDLASDDFATRDRAQRQLDQTPLSARDDLARLADATTDPEAQTRLRGRVELLDDLRVTSTPPISLDVRDAPLADVAAALAKATGQAMTTSISPANANERYTLKADNLPFWEIHRQLSAQHPLWFNVGVNDIRINRDNVAWRDENLVRGMAVFIQDVKAPPTPRAGAAVNTRYTSTLGLGIDPRICILQLKPPEFANITDNAGTRWTATPESAYTSTISLGRGIAFTRPFTLEPAAAAVGKTIPALRGAFPIVVQSAVESKSLDPAKDALNMPFILGNLQISVTQCSVADGSPGVNATIKFDLAVHVAPGKDTDPPPFPIGPVTVNILDATGKTVIVRTLPLGFIGTMANALSVPATPPVTMRLDVTTAVREVKVPFEFKDVPLP